MSVKRFKFVSPGIFLNEIDNSRLPRPPSAVGPTIIGRLEKGPGLVPLTVQSMAQFVEVFGEPMPGGEGGDIWRDGNRTAPSYAAYAAQAYLQNSGPVNVVRLLGVEDSNASTAGAAGFKLGITHTDGYGGDASFDPTKHAMAYGLYLFSKGNIDHRKDLKGIAGHGGAAAATDTNITGTLAAVWYFEKGAIVLSGSVTKATFGTDHNIYSSGTKVGTTGGATTGSYVALKALDKDKMEFAAILYDAKNETGTDHQIKEGQRVIFNFDEDSDRYIRKVFNTNPTIVNSSITQGDGVKNYWLGESYDRFVRDMHGKDSENKNFKGLLTAQDNLSAMIVPLHKTSGHANPMARQVPNKNSVTGWFFSQDILAGRLKGSFDATKHTEKLFRFHGINDGGWNSSNLKISITDLKAGNQIEPYGTFTVLIRKAHDSDGRPVVVERYTNCSLNPNSSDFIGLKIGDQYREWDDADKRYRVYGDFPNQSAFVRVETTQEVADGVAEPTLLPFGFYGPPRIKQGQIKTGARMAAVRGIQASAQTYDASNTHDVLFEVSGSSRFAYKAGGAIEPMPTNSTKATATLTYSTDQGAPTDNTEFAMPDSDGTTSTFIVTDGGNTADGSVNGDGKFIIGIHD